MNPASYLLAAVIFGIGVLAALLTLSIPAHFSSEGGDAGRTVGFAAGLVVLSVCMFIVKRHTPFSDQSSTNDEV